jgi:hypothetical protein
MKTVLLFIIAVGLVWWLSQSRFTLPGVGLVQLSWPAATVFVALLYMVFVLIPWLARSDT